MNDEHRRSGLFDPPRNLGMPFVSAPVGSITIITRSPERERERERQRQRQRQRQRDRERQRQTDRQTDRDRQRQRQTETDRDRQRGGARGREERERERERKREREREREPHQFDTRSPAVALQVTALLAGARHTGSPRCVWTEQMPWRSTTPSSRPGRRLSTSSARSSLRFLAPLTLMSPCLTLGPVWRPWQKHHQE